MSHSFVSGLAHSSISVSKVNTCIGQPQIRDMYTETTTAILRNYKKPLKAADHNGNVMKGLKGIIPVHAFPSPVYPTLQAQT